MGMIHHLNIDIETFSSVNIGKAGLYKYVQSPDFEILLLACSFDDSPVQIFDLANGEQLPSGLREAFKDPEVIKHAYNAAFEWYCLNKFFDTPLEQWRCTMLHGLYCGYPAGLKKIGAALGLPQDKQKATTGDALIRYFCVPCKPTKANGGRRRNLPHHEPKRWRLFKEYCRQDVVTEMAVESRLRNFPVPAGEEQLWRIDLGINAGGVRADRELIEGALYCDAVIKEALFREAVEITGLKNPNSVKQLKEWLMDNDEDVENLRKETVARMIESTDEAKIKRMLEIRLETSKSSVKKYAAMQEAQGDDDRIRGLILFYGANRTGRWAGKLVQVHNLPRNYIGTLDIARQYAKTKKVEALKTLYGNVPDTLSQLIRTAFIPSEGNSLYVADFSAIEARIVTWLAREHWRQEVFATHGKIYEASASAMFNVPIERIVKGNPEYELRQKGKAAELALGYQGGVGALKKTGALEKGLKEEELPEIVQRWRASNKRIVDLWYALENVAIETVETGRAIGYRNIVFRRERNPQNDQDFLTIMLPSGRKLFYVKPFLAPNRFDRQGIYYHGTLKDKWVILDTYGGKLTENIVQAIARDCLAVSIARLHRAGYRIVMHIHDEVVIEAPATDKSEETLNDICSIMCEPIPWAQGLLLRADGFTAQYYQKG